MKLGSLTVGTREDVVHEYALWHEHGRSIVPSARVLAGLFTVLYRKRYRLSPISPVQEDVQEFQKLLRLLHDDPMIAASCLEAAFAIKDFQVTASAFGNVRVLEKWRLVERAHQYRAKRHGLGEQAEFRSDRTGFGSVRV